MEKRAQNVGGWVIYHDLSLLEAQNVGGGLDPEKSLAGGLNIVP